MTNLNSQYRQLYSDIDEKLDQYVQEKGELVGISGADNRNAFILQIVDSVRRVKFQRLIRARANDISPNRHATDDGFDPFKSAVLHSINGNFDEACWLIFLATHFGKNKETEWRLLKDFYGAFQAQPYWTWQRISNNPGAVTQWLTENYGLFVNDGILRKFGNHRKYESINPSKQRSTDKVIQSYVAWIGTALSHQEKIDLIATNLNGDRKLLFKNLYDSMRSVLSFGRTGKFDYLTTLSNLGIVEIEADSTYMDGATGPLKGAKLLLFGNRGNSTATNILEDRLTELDTYLSVGMQVLEDSLCNWQKSPSHHIRFIG
jgi:hypothetical protein